MARERDVSWIWIDTCCIDRRSSAELSEAINSMWKWYSTAQECYVHLADVFVTEDERSLLRGGLDLMDEDEYNSEQLNRDAETRNLIKIEQCILLKFEKSQWFTRGWTLQELLAPQRLHFFSAEWEYMATKGDDGPIDRAVSPVTKIPAAILNSRTLLGDTSVAQRMSWMSNRYTTRTEDKAYCLLGLFNVNMPLLYGEGENAWRRLQQEIIRTSNDESIFAWKRHLDFGPLNSLCLQETLAPGPAYFALCGQVEKRRSFIRPAYAITNRGLELRLTPTTAIELAKASKQDRERIILFPLNCVVKAPLSEDVKRLSDEDIAEATRVHHDVFLLQHYGNTLATAMGEEYLTLRTEPYEASGKLSIDRPTFRWKRCALKFVRGIHEDYRRLGGDLVLLDEPMSINESTMSWISADETIYIEL